jgi:hypothetical protein
MAFRLQTAGVEPSASSLPWEYPNGAEDRDGVCLSGGGLRAACFSLGVLQVLQSERGLIYGPDAAGVLAAVSGGSYTAAAFIAGGRRRSEDPGRYVGAAPLARGSAEEEHILTHGRYLLHSAWRWPLLWVLNAASLVTLFVWSGMMIADAGALGTYVPDDLENLLHHVPAGVMVVLLVASIAILVRGLYLDGRIRRFIVAVPGLALLYGTSRPALQWADGRGTFWKWQNIVLIIVVLLLVLAGLVGAVLIARRRNVRGPAAGGLNMTAGIVIRLIGTVLLAATAVAWYRKFAPVFADESHGTAGLFLLFFGTLVGGVLFSYIPERASLHREYRRRLESCFSIVRSADGSGVEPIAGAPLSTAPPVGGDGRFPRLLVCATGNVRGHQRGGARWTFVPFVLSHDFCGVPGQAEARFPSGKLELGRVPAGLLTRRKEPLLSLFTAVAATGAAVSPSMGRYTVPSARPVLAAMNVRLGRWLPNPFSARMRQAVLRRTTPGRFDPDKRLGPGYDELVPEMWGLDGPRIYVSDGGHYDNLGLLALLRMYCRRLWCVDASPDPCGLAAELHRVLDIAREELNITVEFDEDCFSAGADGLYPTTHVTRLLTYPDGRTARLIVLKLGLTAASDSDLLARRGGPKDFPYHPTVKQIYGRDRMDAYCRVGREVAERALSELSLQECGSETVPT